MFPVHFWIFLPLRIEFLTLYKLFRIRSLIKYYLLFFRNHPLIVPFRETKLTRLFQGFFLGKGKAAMIVNTSQCASVFDETYNVLKFSAVAKQVFLHSEIESSVLLINLYSIIFFHNIAYLMAPFARDLSLLYSRKAPSSTITCTPFF